MKKIILLFMLTIALSGCINKTQTTEQTDITGTDGLVMTLPKIPKEIYSGQGLQIPITLENAGAYKVQNGILAISGYDEDIVQFSAVPKIEPINLEGRSQYVKQGEKRTEIFTISKFNLPETKEILEPFHVLACYQYKTQASPQVCINPQSQFGTSAVKGSCDFVDAKISASQGAPVAVTKVETWYFDNQKKVEFRIFVKDVSKKGLVLDELSYAKPCLGQQELKAEEVGAVRAEVYMAGKRLNCYIGDKAADRFTILSAGDGYALSCSAQINPEQLAYTSVLSVYLTYGYVIDNAFAITVKNPNIR